MWDTWVKLYRNLLEKPIWKQSTPEQKTILITLLMMVNYTASEWEWEGKIFTCEPGQIVTSLESIAQKSGKGISIQNVRTALKRFEKLGFLTDESTKSGRLITVENWGKYQGVDVEPNKEPNKDLTKSQQTSNKYLTPKEESKKGRKKEININNIIPPDKDWVIAYVQEKGYGVDVETWFSFYETRGWMAGKNKMKDWKASIRYWNSQEAKGYEGNRKGRNSEAEKKQTGERDLDYEKFFG